MTRPWNDQLRSSHHLSEGTSNCTCSYRNSFEILEPAAAYYHVAMLERRVRTWETTDHEVTTVTTFSVSSSQQRLSWALSCSPAPALQGEEGEWRGLLVIILSCFETVSVKQASRMEHLVTSIENYVINMLQQRFGTNKQENVRIVKNHKNSCGHHRRSVDHDPDESRPINMVDYHRGNVRKIKNMPQTGSVGFDSRESDEEFSSTEDDQYNSTSRSQKKKLIKRNRKKASDYQELIFGMDMDLM